MRIYRIRVILASLAFSVCTASVYAQIDTRNVVLIVSDGLRRQEVFTGADPTLLDEQHGSIWESAESCAPSIGPRRRTPPQALSISLGSGWQARPTLWQSQSRQHGYGGGSGLVGWKEHGVEEKGSANIWIAIIGPDTAGLGERVDAGPVTQSQIIATISVPFGKDFTQADTEAAPPIKDAIATQPAAPQN